MTYLPNVTGSYSYTGCQGDGFSIDVNGTTYDEANTSGSETITAGASNGCDSTVTINLVYDICTCPPELHTETYNGCTGDGYAISVNGTTYDEANPNGTETFVGGAFSGCDSIVTISLTYLPNVTGSFNYTGCQGDGFSIDVNGTTYNEANASGTELIVGGAANGCDSIVTVSLTYLPNVAGSYSYTGCQGDGFSIDVNGTTYDEANTSGSETITGGASNGCDSTVTINLVYDICTCPPELHTETYTGCAGDGYAISVNGSTYDEANPNGTETFVGGAFSGCDSIVTISLTYLPNVTGSFNYTGCQGDGFSIDVNGTTYDEANASGTELIVGGAANGCDSTVTISLTYLPNVTGSFSYTGCQGDGFSIDVNGTTYDEANASGTELIVGGAANGCDSTVTISLAYLPNATGSFSYTGCQGDGFSIDVNGTTYDEANTSGSETIVGGAANGCDSTLSIDLSYLPVSSGDVSYLGCMGDGYSIDINGTTYDEGNQVGVETIIGGAANGCDSVVNVALVYDDCSCPTEFHTETYSGCQGDGYGILVNGTSYNEANPSGVETFVGGAHSGCDSVVTISFVFKPNSDHTESYVGCSGDGYSIDVNGTIYNEANPNGVEVFVGGSFEGCDSTVTIDLIFNALPANGSETYSGCLGDGYSVDVNGTTYDENNPIGTEVLTGGGNNGCDSTVNINLFYDDCSCPPVFHTATNTSCSGDGYSIDVNGTTYNEANPIGVEVFVGGSYEGCDSTVTIDLTFIPLPANGSETYSGCQGDGYSVNVNGTSYDEGNPNGIEVLAGGSSVGCDSTVIIALTFHALPADGSETYIGCEGDGYSVDVNGTTYDEANPAGTEVLIGGSSNGCDSTVNINLMYDVCVCPGVSHTETYVGCTGDGFSIVVNGTAYNEGNPNGVEVFVGGSFEGCDSTVTVDLTYRPNTFGAQSLTICSNDSATINGVDYYNVTGVYVETIAGLECDSIVTLTLTVETSPSLSSSFDLCEGDSVSVDGVNYYDTPGNYQVPITGGPCDGVHNVSVSILPISFGTDAQTICQGQSATINGVDFYTTSGVYIETIPGFVCDSVVTLTLVVTQPDAVSVTQVTCDPNLVGVNVLDLTNSLGCDSIVTVTTSLGTVDLDNIVAIDADCAGFGGSAEVFMNTGVPPFTYEVTDAGGNVTTTGNNPIAPLNSGTYTITVYDAGNCSVTSGFTIGKEDSVIAFDVTPAYSHIELGGSVQFQSDPADGIITWLPPHFLNCDDCADPESTPDYSVQYVIQRDDAGCMAYDTVYIEVEEPQIYIPTAFTPDGDGHNDVFQVIDKNINEFVFLRVFNRWGELLFETDDIEEGWNGFFKDEEQELDTYVYHLKVIFYNDKPLELTGMFLLLR